MFHKRETLQVKTLGKYLRINNPRSPAALNAYSYFLKKYGYR